MAGDLSLSLVSELGNWCVAWIGWVCGGCVICARVVGDTPKICVLGCLAVRSFFLFFFGFLLSGFGFFLLGECGWLHCVFPLLLHC